jgi:glycosyltransferase involved in cell wall biosynthesis
MEFLLGGKITVIPLLSGSGVRIKLLEALALGIPVISTGIGAEGVNVVNGEHLLIADNPREFAHAIALLLDDEELRITLSYNARKLIESQYNLDSISLSLVNFYRQVSENRIAY